MSKGLEALEEIKTCKLIDHVKVKEGLFSNKLLNYERRYGKDVFSKQIPIIEKELKALEIIRTIGFHETEYIMCVSYNTYCESRDNPIPKEEYDLLKEVLYGKETS